MLRDACGCQGVDLKVSLEVFGGKAVKGFEVDGAWEVDETVELFWDVEFSWGFGFEGLRLDPESLELVVRAGGGEYGMAALLQEFCGCETNA